VGRGEGEVMVRVAGTVRYEGVGWCRAGGVMEYGL